MRFSNLISTVLAFMVFSTLLVSHCQGANILFFFRFSTYSHRITVWPLVEALADKGHSVTFLQSDENKNPNPKVKEIVVKNDLPMPDFMTHRREMGGRLFAFYHAYHIPTISAGACNDFLNDPDMISWINSSKFDLVVIDALYNDCGFGLAYKWKAKTVIFGTSSVFEYWPDAYGFPAESNWISNIHFGLEQDMPLKFFNRILPTLAHLYFRYSIVGMHHPRIEDNLKTKLNIPDMPSLMDMASNVSLVLMNTHFSEEVARSLPPLIVPIGGMHCSEKGKLKPLPKEMEKFINDSNNGFVYVSFGSGAKISSADKEIQNAFFNAFKNTKTRFLWKWEGIRPKEMPENVYTADWMPQQAILAHPKIRAFITHGGLLSMQEAIFNGVPMISFPIFAEQDYNAERLHRTKRGISLEISTLTQEQLEDALDKILNDEIYLKTVRKASVVFKDRPEKPVDTAVWWVEYVLRHDDTSFLRPLSISQTWYERRLLDVWAFIFFVVFLVIWISIFVIRKVFSCLFEKCFRSSSEDKGKKVKVKRQ